ncbi:MAG TPA: hypothetical protein VGC53_07100 [Vicinamibacteria bacterium]|jgi:hypothetical protein
MVKTETLVKLFVALALQQLICIGGLTYVIHRQQLAIEALIDDQFVSVGLDGKLSRDLQRIRREMKEAKDSFEQ